MKSITWALVWVAMLTVPSPLLARMAVMVVPENGSRSVELAGLFADRIGRTHRYLLLPAPEKFVFDPGNPACPDLPRTELLLLVSASDPGTDGRYKGTFRMWDCRINRWLGEFESRSQQLPNVASNLKDHAVLRLPYRNILDAAGSTVCLPGSQAAASRAGERLWWYGGGGFMGRLIVREQALDDGCAAVSVDYRVAMGIELARGQMVMDRPPAQRPATVYSTPGLGHVFRVAEGSTAGSCMPGTVCVAEIPALESAWIARTGTAASVRQAVFWWNAERLRSGRNAGQPKTGYRFAIDGRGWSLDMRNARDRTQELAQGERPRIPEGGGMPEMEFVHEGRRTDIYADGRFVIGLDDDSLYGGEFVAELLGHAPDGTGGNAVRTGFSVSGARLAADIPQPLAP